MTGAVYAVELPGLKPCGDVSDWLDGGKSKDDLLAFIETVDDDSRSPMLQQAMDAAEIARLAALSDMQYSRERIKAAKALGIKVSTLDRLVKGTKAADATPHPGTGSALNLSDIEPWHEPVDGQELVLEIVACLKKHVVFASAHHPLAVALWSMHAHLFPLAEHSPRLHITAPTKACGKTVLLNTVAALVPRPLRVEHVTTAALFRVIEEHQPTLLIDEVDTFLKDNEEMRGLLNAGHQPDAQVVRCVGENQEVHCFSVFAAIALAGIGEIPPTIEDRSITISLRRRVPEDGEVERLRRNREHLKLVARRMARWAADNAEKVMGDPPMPESLGDRPQDNWRALIAIADAIGPDVGVAARAAALGLEGEKDHDDNDGGLMALTDVHGIFCKVDGDGPLSSQFIVQELIKMVDRPWAQWKRGSPLTQHTLARLLKPFGIQSGQIKPANCKGYKRDPVVEAFTRYCAPKSDEELGESCDPM